MTWQNEVVKFKAIIFIVLNKLNETSSVITNKRMIINLVIYQMYIQLIKIIAK